MTRNTTTPTASPVTGSSAVLLSALEKIHAEAVVANDVIRLNRDGKGNGRVKVATAMQRISVWAEAALRKGGDQ